MKTFLSFLVFQILIGTYLIGQNTLIVYTKFPNNLKFVDELNRPLAINNLWDETAGGYIINYNDLKGTYVESDKMASFKISTAEKLTKLILMNQSEKLSIINCLTSEKYCCERLTDKQKKGTEKLFAMAVMKKAGNQELALEFNENNLHEFVNANDVVINWYADTIVSKISLLDISEIEIVWEAENYELNHFAGKSLPEEIKKKFIFNHNYQLNIEFSSTDINEMASKYSFDFSIKPLAFNTTAYYFPSVESIDISWKSIMKIANIQLRELYAENSLWKSNSVDAENFNLPKILKDNNIQLMPGTDYELIINLSNTDLQQTEYSYPFSVMLNSDESAEMKQLLNDL